MHVLVTGATGFVGSHLVEALCRTGHDVRVLVRDPAEYDPPPGVEVAAGDLLDPGSFEEALAGVDAAYYLVHSMRAGADYADRDRRAARNFRTAAESAGVDRVVYLGGLGGEDGLSEHLASRREVETLLAAGEYDLTALRAAIIVGEGSASFRVIRALSTRFPVLVAPKWVRTDCQPIAIDDVVAYLVGLLDAPETAGETYEIGGPEVMSYAEILRRTGDLLGRTGPRIVPVPMFTPGVAAYWVGLLTDVPTSVARPLVDGLKTPVVADDTGLDDVVPVDATSFEAAVRRAATQPRQPAPQRVVAAGGDRR
ncbi:NAD(P)H-binding protein [Haloarcula pelagica]|uniref:NAD(P)H-binding protein n=1 Tax=Haloarcula pelagica TaxID=3033389 RepID=UPI0024C2DA78|nr:NAD(P)H-binding protein [Halomicroarcula sp. YJ-61-S]